MLFICFFIYLFVYLCFTCVVLLDWVWMLCVWMEVVDKRLVEMCTFIYMIGEVFSWLIRFNLASSGVRCRYKVQTRVMYTQIAHPRERKKESAALPCMHTNKCTTPVHTNPIQFK